jgi:hypothetical protein
MDELRFFCAGLVDAGEDLAPVLDDPDYKAGWLQGWMAATGCDHMEARHEWSRRVNPSIPVDFHTMKAVPYTDCQFYTVS